VIGLDSLIDTIQWRYHDVGTDHIPLSNDIAVHDLGLDCTSFFLCPLSNPSLGTNCKHDAAKEPTRILPKTNNPKKNILVW
jgi:hypothetical protein